MDTQTLSPAISTGAVFLSAAVNAYECRKVVTVDIEGAYFYAKMTSVVIMQISKEASSILVQMYSKEYAGYVDDKSVLYVKLGKALYGCIESALLLYKHLFKALHEIGFNPNSYDPCAFN
jgi:hypothetical protein